MRTLSQSDRYKLLTGVVVPRPIAWVTTLNPDGTVNAAPFSFFGAMGSDPPLIAFGPGDREGETPKDRVPKDSIPKDSIPKDTAANVRREREFVVNLVPADLAEAMNVTASEFPRGKSELEEAGLSTAPSNLIRAPRIAQSPVNLECREVMTLEIGRNRVVLGEVVALHVRDDLMLDAAKFYVNSAKLGLIGRMGGRGGYVRTTDVFELPRLSYDQWLAKREQEK